MTDIDWDSEADSFDQEPDHGLLDPGVRAAWASRLSGWLPGRPADVLDLGCGTGSLALLAVEQGHRVTAVDLSPRMAALAGAKLAGTGAEVLVGDAARPPVGERTFDVVLARHLLWMMPDVATVLRHWVSLLRPGGRLVLVEGVWAGAGLPAADLIGALEPLTERVLHDPLSDEPALWGRDVSDERYALVARLAERAAPGRDHPRTVAVPAGGTVKERSTDRQTTRGQDSGRKR
jgi:SAM-dependent methyltransferase